MSKNNNLSGGLFAAKPTPLTIKETSLSNQIAEYLNARFVYNDRLQCGKMMTQKGNWIHFCKVGTPDRFAIIRGQMIFIEVKKLGQKPTNDQIERQYLIRQSGAIVIVADSFVNFVYQFLAVRSEIEQATQTNKKEKKLYV